MNETQPFRVALSGAFQNDDGTAVFPMFDLSPLENDSKVEFEYLANKISFCNCPVTYALKLPSTAMPYPLSLEEVPPIEFVH